MIDKHGTDHVGLLSRFGRWLDDNGNRTSVVVQVLLLVTQTGLLVAAIIGFFYTVVPLYSKAVLEEGIAQKELEIKSKEVALARIGNDLLNAKQQLDATTHKLQAESQARRKAAIVLVGFDIEAHCSGMMKEPPPFPKFGDPIRTEPEDILLSIPIDECLRDQIKQLKSGPSLTADDIDRFRKAVELSIPHLEAKRGDVAVLYQRIRQEHASALEQLNARRQRELVNESDPARKRALIVSSIREAEDLSEKQAVQESAILAPYRALIRESLNGAAKTVAAGIQ